MSRFHFIVSSSLTKECKNMFAEGYEVYALGFPGKPQIGGRKSGYEFREMFLACRNRDKGILWPELKLLLR